VLAIDGIDLVNTNVSAEIDRLNDALAPFAIGQSHAFTVQDPGGGPQRTVSMTSANVTSTPVQAVRTFPTASGPVGYLLFNDHIATSEAGLVNAITTLRDAGVVDLVLDVRYNGGGFLDIASELAYMIAGNARTSGRTFELLQFNDQHTVRNPVTGETLAPLPFHSTAEGFSVAPGTALPALNLGRVYVLTSSAASMRNSSATTRKAFHLRIPWAPRACRCPAARSPMTSRTRSATSLKGGSRRRSTIARRAGSAA
jgi:hypothetical protein